MEQFGYIQEPDVCKEMALLVLSLVNCSTNMCKNGKKISARSTSRSKLFHLWMEQQST